MTKRKAPATAATDPIVAMADRAREAGATDAVMVFRLPNGRRRVICYEHMTWTQAAGLLAMAQTDLAFLDLPDEEDEG